MKIMIGACIGSTIKWLFDTFWNLSDLDLYKANVTLTFNCINDIIDGFSTKNHPPLIAKTLTLLSGTFAVWLGHTFISKGVISQTLDWIVESPAFQWNEKQVFEVAAAICSRLKRSNYEVSDCRWSRDSTKAPKVHKDRSITLLHWSFWPWPCLAYVTLTSYHIFFVNNEFPASKYHKTRYYTWKSRDLCHFDLDLIPIMWPWPSIAKIMS